MTDNYIELARAKINDKLNSISGTEWQDSLPEFIIALSSGDLTDGIGAVENLIRMAKLADKQVKVELLQMLAELENVTEDGDDGIG